MNSQLRKNKKGKGKGKPKRAIGASGFDMPLRSIIPLKMRGPIQYCTTVGLSIAATTVTDYVFRTNSIFDPDLTGVGTTTAMYTPLSTLYNYYRVWGCKAKVSFLATAAVPSVVGICANANAGTFLTLPVLNSQPLSWSAPLDGTGGMGHVKRSFSFQHYQVLGLTKQQYGTGTEFWSVVTGSPSNGTYFHVAVYSPTASAAAVLITVELILDVEFSEPKQRALS
jgi:hypothetical protein